MSAISLDTLSAAIVDRERLLDASGAYRSGAACALAHARKEWGHAANWPEHREFHFGIVQRDLDDFAAEAAYFGG